MIFNLNTSLSKGESRENARRQACKGEVSRVCVGYLPHTVQDGLSQAERPNLPPSYPPQTNSFLTNSRLDKHQRRGKITSLPPNPLLSCRFSDWGRRACMLEQASRKHRPPRTCPFAFFYANCHGVIFFFHCVGWRSPLRGGFGVSPLAAG